MALSDPRYLLFLTLAVLCFWRTPKNVRGPLLFAFSIGFVFLLGPKWYIPFVVAGVAYGGAILLRRMREGANRDAAFVAVLLATFTPLIVFKYLPSIPFIPIGWGGAGVLLPIGLSFYTFASVGYLIDVYIENIEPERRPLTFLNFIFFFPNFSVGPIERASHFIPQLDRLGEFDYRRSVSALQLILLGYLYKIVFADSLAPYVDDVFSSHATRSSADLALATVYFAFQVYSDFAGYSLIAIGSARLLGIELLPNFRQPYFSTTVAEFWRRWHMSLSNWFRDYVFTPLHFRLRKRGRVGMTVALIASFVLVGIWHGAGPQFLIFGLIHGLLVVSSMITLARRDAFWESVGVPAGVVACARVGITFTVVCSTLVLFRAANFEDAVTIYSQAMAFDGATTIPVLYPALIIALLLVIDCCMYKGFEIYSLCVQMRWALYYASIALVMSIAVFHLSQGSSYAQQFIYFKF